jgi:pimeloyl-ACP methyl ester carboxylesterase
MSSESTPTKLHFVTRGEGPPLVLIMGLGADGSVWEEHVKAYETHFKCYLLDNRGIGLSLKPAGPYTTALMADDVAATMDAAGIASAAVAGLSMGGAIAQELALRHPTRVTKLVLVSTWAQCDDYMKRVFTHFKDMRAVCTLGQFMQLLLLWIWTPAWMQAHSADMDQACLDADSNDMPQPRQGFEGQCDACITHDTVERLSNITVPTLITIGTLDIFTPPACSEFLHAHLPGSRLVHFTQSGHVHHWEALADFNATTTHFLLED